MANARRNLDRWLEIKQEDEAPIRAAEDRVQSARAALALATGRAAMADRVTCGIGRGSRLGLAVEAAELASAQADLTTAENELARLRNQQLALTERNVRRADARWRAAEAAFRQDCE